MLLLVSQPLVAFLWQQLNNSKGYLQSKKLSLSYLSKLYVTKKQQAL